jgi:hypothetical protein
MFPPTTDHMSCLNVRVVKVTSAKDQNILQLLGTILKCWARSYDNQEAHCPLVLFHSSHK